jgi:integrase
MQRALFETAYTFGFRLGELRAMRCRQINFVTGTIALETSKNGEPREAFMTQSVRLLLKALCEGKGPDAFVFTRGKQRAKAQAKKCEEDSRLKDFRKCWAAVCVAAKVGALHCPTCNEKIDVESKGPYPHCGREWRRSDLTYSGLIFHDLRRCAVRGLLRAGIAQKTAMMVTGHRTVSTFQRYAIIAPSDLKEATRKLETSQKQERDLLAKSNVPSFGLSSDRVARKAGQAAGIALPIPPTAMPVN